MPGVLELLPLEQVAFDEMIEVIRRDLNGSGIYRS